MKTRLQRTSLLMRFTSTKFMKFRCSFWFQYSVIVKNHSEVLESALCRLWSPGWFRYPGFWPHIFHILHLSRSQSLLALSLETLSITVTFIHSVTFQALSGPVYQTFGSFISAWPRSLTQEALSFMIYMVHFFFNTTNCTMSNLSIHSKGLSYASRPIFWHSMIQSFCP